MSGKSTDQLAAELAQAIVNGEEYLEYQAALLEIKKNPELYDQVNNLRRNHFMVQNGDTSRMTFEEYTSLSNESKRLRENPVVTRFLDAEIAFGRLIKDINRTLMKGIEFDDDFLD